MSAVPVAVRQKLKAVERDLGSQAEVARVLGVSRSRVSRWLKDAEPDPKNRRKPEGVEFVLGRLLELYDAGTAGKWLRGLNAHLGDRRPVDLLAAGRVAEVLQAIEAEEAGAYA
ncbi:MAG: helix-turn-helix domain-containing protein [Actinobacteria bacterium]|nr:helix-turn-helix domain-containing protein [Actinomycetota bacterium]